LSSRRNRFAWIIALVAIFSLVAAACSDDSSDSSSDDTGGSSEDGGGASGEVIVSGSSTVEPISIAVAEALEDTGSAVAVDVDGPGTGDGFELFCNGETDISDASRPIKAEEVESCEANDIEFIELKVAIDGISVLTNPANDSVTCLSFADVYGLMGPESGDVENWDGAAPIAEALGSTTEFPDASLDINAPGAESGTYDSFIEIVLEPVAEIRLEDGDIDEEQADSPVRQFPGQSDDTLIVQGIEGSDSSFGWVGFAFAEGAGDGVKEIEISEEPDGDCVAPTEETIADGSYPVSRSLYIYVNAAAADENDAVVEYVDFYLGDGIAQVSEVGYVSLPDDQLAATAAVWEARETGTSEG
jgi:phosphate transport system substrate-binding protein